MTQATRIRFGKFGLAEDPRGLIVRLPYQGRDLLGKVRDARFCGVLGYTLLTVQHFNGEMWPIEPAATAVDVVA